MPGGEPAATGIVGRLAAFALLADMIVAMATLSFDNGIVSSAAGAGCELKVALTGLAAVVAIVGCSRMVVDHRIRSLWTRRGEGAWQPASAR